MISSNDKIWCGFWPVDSVHSIGLEYHEHADLIVSMNNNCWALINRVQIDERDRVRNELENGYL